MITRRKAWASTVPGDRSLSEPAVSLSVHPFADPAGPTRSCSERSAVASRGVAAKPTPFVDVLRTCAQTILQRSRWYLLRTSWRKWRRWLAWKQRVARCMHRLIRIRRAALIHLVLRYFSAWTDVCLHSRNAAEAGRLETLCHRHLVARYFDTWMRLCLRLRRLELEVLPSLLVLRQESQRALLLRILHRWWKYSATLQSLRYIAERGRASWVRSVLVRWRRRRNRRAQTAVAAQLLRRSLRQWARWCFSVWMRWAVNAKLAVLVEQRNLALVLHDYVRKWRIAFYRNGRLASLRRRSLLRCAQGCFGKWVRFVRRTIRACMLEQQHLVRLLQQYFIFWKVSVEERRLSYTHMRKLSTSLHRLAAAQERKS